MWAAGQLLIRNPLSSFIDGCNVWGVWIENLLSLGTLPGKIKHYIFTYSTFIFLYIALWYHFSSLSLSVVFLFAFLSSPFLPFYAPHHSLQGHFDNTWCRWQAADTKLSISLSNGVMVGLCWPLNSLQWRRRPLAAASVWHSLLAACLISAGWSHFRVKSWAWQRRTFSAGDWWICSIYCNIPYLHCKGGSSSPMDRKTGLEPNLKCSESTRKDQIYSTQI